MVFPIPDPADPNYIHKIGVRNWVYSGDRWELAQDSGLGGNHYFGDTAPPGKPGDLWTDSKTLLTYAYNGREWAETGRGTVS